MTTSNSEITKKKDSYMLEDSGDRRKFSTGAVRDCGEGKGRFDLIPPFALTALALHYERGSLKYGDRNWLKGIPISKFIDSCIRHLIRYMKGGREEPHLVAAMWNIVGAVETLERIELGLLPVTLDDLPYPLLQKRSFVELNEASRDNIRVNEQGMVVEEL